VSSIKDEYLHVKLGDFGYARLAEEDESISHAGTREYIAPVSYVLVCNGVYALIPI
jgi:hypothetical protein